LNPFQPILDFLSVNFPKVINKAVNIKFARWRQSMTGDLAKT